MAENRKHYVCEKCGKGVQYAHNVSHAKNRTKTVKKPNLRKVRVIVGGKIEKMRLCMKCLKSVERPGWKPEEKKEGKSAK